MEYARPVVSVDPKVVRVPESSDVVGRLPIDGDRCCYERPRDKGPLDYRDCLHPRGKSHLKALPDYPRGAVVGCVVLSCRPTLG